MYFPDTPSKMRVAFEAKQFDFQPEEAVRFREGLRPLQKVVEQYPVSALFVTIHRHPRSKDYHVTTALHVPSRTLFTGERHDDEAYPAFERCVRKLVRKVEAHRDQLSHKTELAKSAAGKYHEVLPDHEPDVEALWRAAADGDYRAFREHLDVYHDPVRLRVGRWIQRYPRIEAQLGDSLSIEDIVEEVFLLAFDGFHNRPKIRFGIWLETLIHQSVKKLLRQPEAEKENLSVTRSFIEMGEL
jgi:ribosome-associated translation inhibitor RaiA